MDAGRNFFIQIRIIYQYQRFLSYQWAKRRQKSQVADCSSFFLMLTTVQLTQHPGIIDCWFLSTYLKYRSLSYIDSSMYSQTFHRVPSRNLNDLSKINIFDMQTNFYYKVLLREGLMIIYTRYSYSIHHWHDWQ